MTRVYSIQCASGIPRLPELWKLTTATPCSFVLLTPPPHLYGWLEQMETRVRRHSVNVLHFFTETEESMPSMRTKRVTMDFSLLSTPSVTESALQPCALQVQSTLFLWTDILPLECPIWECDRVFVNQMSFLCQVILGLWPYYSEKLTDSVKLKLRNSLNTRDWIFTKCSVQTALICVTRGSISHNLCQGKRTLRNILHLSPAKNSFYLLKSAQIAPQPHSFCPHFQESLF